MSPASVEMKWKWLAALLHSVSVVFELFFSGREADAISVSSTRIQVIFRDLIHKRRNTMYGGFSLLPDTWYSALL